MRLPKEMIVLLVLLLGAIAFVLWYVAKRRAENRAAAPVAAHVAGPGPLAPAKDVELGGRNEGKTIDFSSGQPIVKDSAEDQKALSDALAEIEAATKEVSFGPADAPKKN